jgi:enamine deaminase RidA (YjgF/YER057c/UK114 family)
VYPNIEAANLEKRRAKPTLTPMDNGTVVKVHGEVFGEIRPATTIVEVAKLIDGDALIEIEADAVLG